MKNDINLILFLFINILYSQSKIIIEYDYNYAHMRNLKSFIVSDQKDTYFFFSNDPNSNYKNLSENNYSSVNQYHVYKYNFNNEKIYQRVITYPETLTKPIPKLASEKLENLDWKITNEFKQLLGYKVFLATTKFRGRDYKAWFTKNLAYEAFPWKLKGLPGVILEFEDKDGFIKGVAKTITLNSNDEFPNKVLKLLTIDDSNLVIPFKKLTELENEVLQENMNQAIAALPKGAQYEVPNIREMSLERSFEWKSEPVKP